MNKLPILFVSIVVLVTACQPSEAAMQTAVAQSKMAISTVEPTATLLHFSALDLESILIISGDLPPGYEAAQIRNEFSRFSTLAPRPDYYISKAFSHEGEWVGLVEVLVYENIRTPQTAYEWGLGKNYFGKSYSVEIGDSGTASEINSEWGGSSLAFFHCHAMVFINFAELLNNDYAISYGERLDERLMPIICP